jgi:hypothetical protein
MLVQIFKNLVRTSEKTQHCTVIKINLLMVHEEIIIVYSESYRSRVSSGSIVSDYGLDDRAIEVRSPAGAKDFSSSLCVQTGSGAHPTMGTGGPFPGGKSAVWGVTLNTHPI